ncbi:MAG TPA: T9SS type A sorting domain-containing protein [Bacteroidales bacterium]|nr:T9SS type A sorting domain-containing protein [Bacteroidales bacterium]HRZ49604.1 T9SS type A sorting domain-containing protein [Bacteroidales bacterium]
MKKLLLFSFAACFLMAAHAQTPVNDYSGKVPTEKIRFDSQLHKSMLKARNSKTIKSRWYNYAFTMDDILQSSEVAGNNLFPDSTILVNYTSGYSGTWVHLLGNTLDPSSDWFNDNGVYPNEMHINSLMPYTLDSVEFVCYYDRNHPNPAIVDTLIIEIYTSNTSTNFPKYYFGPTSVAAANYGTDTVWFGAYKFNASDLSTKVTGAKVYKFPLTEAFAQDTLDDGTVVIGIATPDVPQVNANQMVLSTFRFKPGYTWIPNVDTLINMNRLFFLAYEENGTGTWSNYTKGDWNASHLGTTNAITPGDSWYEMQIPEWAYTSNTFAYENLIASYKLTADETGIEKVADNILGLNQNQPNPFSDVTTIRYSLSEMADVTFELFDQTGKKVMSEKLGMETPGQHTFEVDARSLQNGIYFYTLTAGQQKASKKMVVLK